MTSRDQIQFSADIIFLKESELKKLIVELNSQSYNNFNTNLFLYLILLIIINICLHLLILSSLNNIY